MPVQRRMFIKSSLAVLSAGAVADVLGGQEDVSQKREYYNHYLLFWLRKDLSERQVVEFAQFFEELKKLPYIQSLHYGQAANTTPRKVVDNSFTYNAVMTFASLEDLEAYGRLPAHLETVNKYSLYWERMQVHDSVLS